MLKGKKAYKIITNNAVSGLEVNNLKRQLKEQKVKLDYYNEHYENLALGCVTLNESGQIEDLNRYAAIFLKRDKNKLIGRHFDQFIHPDGKECWTKLIHKAEYDTQSHLTLVQDDLQSQHLQYCDFRLSEKIDENVFIRIICARRKIDPIKFFITFTNITLQKKAEDNLRVAAVAFETQEAIAVTDAYRSILKVNHAFTQLTGYTAEEAIDQTPAFLQSGLSEASCYEKVWDSVANEGYWQGEQLEQRKNGDIYTALITLSAVYGGNGKITHYVRFSRDISAEKQAEEILLKSHQELENQFLTTKDELERIKSETYEINSALNILLKRRETEKLDAQLNLLSEMESFINPFLKKLKNASQGRRQSSRLIEILESNLQQLVKSYGATETLPAVLLNLTSVEKQVAAMIRQGHPSKVIAATLNSSTGTVNIHRKNIRKKLGLSNQGVNLENYLQSLTEV